MKGPTYIENHPYKVKFQEHSMTLHRNQLKSIKSKKSRLVDSSTPEGYKLKIKRYYKDYYRNDEIFRENQSLLGKLLNIRWNKGELSRNESLQSKNFYPKSVFISKRKKTEKKIVFENKEFANRLKMVSPSMSRKDIIKDYVDHVKYRANLCKLDSSVKIDKKRLKLESIQLTSHANLNSDTLQNKNPYEEDIGTIIKKE